MASITNKFLSAEILGTLILTAFAIGTTWASLDSKAQTTEAKVITLTKQQDAISKDMNNIRSDLAVIRNEQQHLADSIAEIKEQNKELSKIRQLLENLR